MPLPVVLLPSLGRGGGDFADLAQGLRSDGRQPVAVDPRPTFDPGATLHDLASEVVRQVDAAGLGAVHLVGHAFGNRLARMVTADHPDRVSSLTLLAAGGYLEMDPDIAHSLLSCFDPRLSPAEHLEHVRRAFFAPGHDPSAWTGGWMPEVAAYQRRALELTRPEEWWDATAPHVLVVQALQDAVALVGNGRRYVADHADVATLVEIDGAGHAMLPEQPEAIARALLEFLASTGT